MENNRALLREQLTNARALWKAANEFSNALPTWGNSEMGNSLLVSGAALYGLAQTISHSAGSCVLLKRKNYCPYEHALRENLMGVVRAHGPRYAAELAYQLTDGIATGELRR